MRRRCLLLLAGALLAPLAGAQARTPRIGILSALPLDRSAYGGPLVKSLAALGYRDGAGAILEYRSVDGLPDRYPKQARELVDLKCDVIFPIGNELPVRALLKLGTPVPVVFWAGDYDPLEKGIVKSLARPEGNMTGVYAPQGMLVAKRVDLLREARPEARRFLVLADPWSRDNVADARKAAAVAGVQLTVIEFSKQPYNFAQAFASGQQEGAEGLILLNSPVFRTHIDEILAFAAQRRLPSAGSGGYPGILLAYYADLGKGAARVAALGARILKGAKPADIPVEQTSEFQLVVNLKTAKTLGLKVPQSLTLRATRVIE